MTSGRSLHYEDTLEELKRNLKVLSKRMESYAAHENGDHTAVMQDYYLLRRQLNQLANDLESLSLPSFTLRDTRAGLVEETDLHLNKLNASHGNFAHIQILQDRLSRSNSRKHLRKNSYTPATREPRSWSRTSLGGRTRSISADEYQAEIDDQMGLRMDQKRRNSKLSRFKQFCNLNSKPAPHPFPPYPLVDAADSGRSSSQPLRRTRPNRPRVSSRATSHGRSSKSDSGSIMSDEPTSHNYRGHLKRSSLSSPPYEPPFNSSSPDRDGSYSDKSARSRYFLPTPATSVTGSRRGSIKDFFTRSPRPYSLATKAGSLRRPSSVTLAFTTPLAQRASISSPRLNLGPVHPYIGSRVPASNRTSGTAHYHTARNTKRTTYSPPSVMDEMPLPELPLQERPPGIQNMADKGTTFMAPNFDSSPGNSRETSTSTQHSGFLYPSVLGAHRLPTTAGPTCVAPTSGEVQGDPVAADAVDESAKMTREELREFFKELRERPGIRPAAPTKKPVEIDIEPEIIDVHPHIRSNNKPGWHEHRSKTHPNFNNVVKYFSADSSVEGPVLDTKYDESLIHAGNRISCMNKDILDDVLEHYRRSSESAAARHKHRSAPAHGHGKHIPEHQNKCRHSSHVASISGRSNSSATQTSPPLHGLVDSQEKYRYRLDSTRGQRAENDAYVYHNNPLHRVNRHSGAVKYPESIRSDGCAVYISGEDTMQEWRRTESVQGRKSEGSRSRRKTQSLRSGSGKCTRRSERRGGKRMVEGWTRKRGEGGCVLM